MNRIDHIFIKLLSVLAQRDSMSEEELATHFDVSVRTIQRYLDDLESILIQLNENLVLNRSDRKNIQLVGNRNKLALVIQKMNRLSSDEENDRIAIMINELLQAYEPLTLQYFADLMYIGKTTVEKTLQEARNYLEQYHVTIEGSRRGLTMDADENQTRKILSDLLRSYWSGVRLNIDRDSQLVDITLNVQAQSLIDQDILKQVHLIIDQFIMDNDLSLTEYQYQSLIIHISIAIDRIKRESFYQKIPQSSSIHTYTIELVFILEDAFNITIPHEEYYYLNLHIETILKIPIADHQFQIEDLEYGKIINHVLNKHLSILNPDNTLLTNLSIHLNTSLKRIQNNSKIQNPHKEYVKSNYTRAFSIAVEIAIDLSNYTQLIFSVDEITYIAIHIQSFFERTTHQQKPIEAILVCASGFGTVKLLEQRLLQRFNQKLDIKETIGLNELSKIHNNDSLIISTIPIESSRSNIIYVNPLLTDQDIKSINQYISDYHRKQELTANDYLIEDLIFFSNGKNENERTVIEFMCSQLIFKGYAEVGLLETVLRRENFSSTAMDLFSMPHGDVRYIKKSVISVYYNSNGILWKGKTVYIAFFMAINPDENNDLKNLYSDFNDFISQESFNEKLLSINNREELLLFLNLGGENNGK